MTDYPQHAPVRVRVIGDLFHGRIPDGAVYIGRAAPGLPASPHANLHRVGTCRACGQHHDRPGAVAAYATDLAHDPDRIRAVWQDLAGVDLACWCRLDGQPCHGDVLLQIANPTTTPALNRSGEE